LINLFSRVGIPKEMLTDQGSNFMSELMWDDLIQNFDMYSVLPIPL
jgi:hypothetical protein